MTYARTICEDDALAAAVIQRMLHEGVPVQDWAIGPYARSGWPDSVRVMPTTLRRSAAVFVTTDLSRALDHYRRLGFTVEAYENADQYGYACRDGIEIHLAKVERVDQSTTTSCVYLWVDDAEALHEEWAAASVDGRLRPPAKTDYGLAEGAHVDPDGNLIRFGSPPLPPRALR